MRFRSVNRKSPPVGFRDALFQGIAPDGGLYVPEAIPKLPPSILQEIKGRSLQSLGAEILSLYIDDIPRNDLQAIVERALDFPISLRQLTDGLFLLELFHGPTLAFKDVGARFMAHALSYFLSREEKSLTILVATSGDTGGAVAHGFYNVPHVTVYILYPSGKVSRLQERQMTTLGGNIRAVEVEGTFDDCQRLVRQTLGDLEVLAARSLTTANSINLGRLLPQIIYYVWGVGQLSARSAAEEGPPDVVVPSGNFGNLTAAVYARWMGTPIGRLVAATNANDVVPEYLRSGRFIPRASIRTLSTAMDVGNPSNLVRLQALYQDDIGRLRHDISSAAISDERTLEEIRGTYANANYILDPHTAVGVAAARSVLGQGGRSHPVIVAATAHPAKFPEIVEEAIKLQIPLPKPLEDALGRKKISLQIPADYDEWKRLLLSQW